MTSLNKKFFKFLSIITLLSYGLYGFNSYAETAIEREAREYSLGVGEVIQDIKDDAQEQQRKVTQQRIQTQNIRLANNRELKCLADNIYYEAGNQSTKGKLAVAAVTINRVNSPKFPQQYAESKKVAEKVLLYGANHGVLGKNVLFYHADYVSPGWNLRRVAKIGDHIFYAG